MNNADFWASIRDIIAEDFTAKGLQKLEEYAEDFISGRLVYKRFSSHEQHGCATGGTTNVIASLLAGAEAGADCPHPSALSNFQRERKCGAQQEGAIERWAKAVGVWIDKVERGYLRPKYLFPTEYLPGTRFLCYSCYFWLKHFSFVLLRVLRS